MVPTPPVVVIVAVPFAPPLQETFVCVKEAITNEHALEEHKVVTIGITLLVAVTGLTALSPRPSVAPVLLAKVAEVV